MTARSLLLVAAVLALLASLVLMVSDDPQPPEPAQLTEQVPFVIDGSGGYLCDITVESNGDRADTAHASCEGEP